MESRQSKKGFQQLFGPFDPQKGSVGVCEFHRINKSKIGAMKKLGFYNEEKSEVLHKINMDWKSKHFHSYILQFIITIMYF